MKSNQNVLEWIKLQKSEKNKITRDKIIDLVNEKTKIEAAQAALYNLKKKNNDTGEVILHKSGQKERTNDQRKDFSDYSKELFGNKERKK